MTPTLENLTSAYLDALTLAEHIRHAHKQARPVLQAALLPVIADAEHLRQRLQELTEAVRAEGS